MYEQRRCDLNKNRPINLDLRTIRFPLAAIASITHRITGVVLFVGMTLLLYLLQTSLSSEIGFATAIELLDKTSVKIAIWATLISISYHLIAGTKHLLLDLGLGETKASAENGAKSLLLCLVILSALAGIWLW